jgi:hypothetical protein
MSNKEVSGSIISNGVENRNIQIYGLITDEGLIFTSALSEFMQAAKTKHPECAVGNIV